MTSVDKTKNGYVDYKCKDCNRSFRNQITTYKQHMLDHHSTKKERKKEFTYYCKLCDIGTFSISTWTNHINTKKHQRIKEIYKSRKK